MANISRKTIVLLALTLLLLAGLFFVFTGAGSRLERYYENKKAQAIVDKMEKPYREDIYGGSTPEETYALFIKALKEENIELAAKYFSPKRQGDWLKNLKSLNTPGKMNEFIGSLPDLSKIKKNIASDDYITFSYNVDYSPEETIEIQGKVYTIPAGPATYEIEFIKNTFTQKWKIEDL